MGLEIFDKLFKVDLTFVEKKFLYQIKPENEVFEVNLGEVWLC